uniref:DRBM domain-containing protein n=1 Tax=Heterorhabditis bacteriophora TaxID=37862 RepID=A0A1I7XSJ4_HETBA
MERIIETSKVRVTVDIGNKMKFTGMGRNYRIAKTTAAKRALRYLFIYLYNTNMYVSVIFCFVFRYLKSLEEQKLREAEKKTKGT